MKTLEEVVTEIKKIDDCFSGKENKDMRNCLKIDLFTDVPDSIFCEALRQTGIDSQDFVVIQYTRHTERKNNN